MAILGIDIDNTLTNTSSPWNSTSKDKMDLNIERQLLLVDERHGVEILNECDMNIIIITTRHEEYRDATLKWLQRKSIKFDKLVMRNFRFSTGVFNISEYLQYKHNACLQHKVNYMLDDDENVVNMLNKNGIISILVDKNGRFDTSYFQLLKKMR